MIVFVPRGHRISAWDIAARIETNCTVARKYREETAGTCGGVLNVYFFEYTDVQAVATYTTIENVLIIVSQPSIGEFTNERDYLDELNKIFDAKPYTVLSISDLHESFTEQSASDTYTRIIQRSGCAEVCVINQNLEYYFRGDHDVWCSDHPDVKYCCGVQVRMECK